MKKSIVVIHIFFFLLFAASAEEDLTAAQVLNWFATDQRAVRYRQYEKEIEEILERAQEHRVTLELLFEKLKEGATKGVTWEKLSKALSSQYESVTKAEEIVANAEGVHGKGKSKEHDSLVKHTSLFLDGGLDPALVVAPLLAASLSAHGDTGRFTAACEMLIEIGSFGVENRKTLYALGDALVRSRLSEASYASISSLFVKARARGMDSDEIAALFSGIVKRGGGIVQIEQELERRLRNK